MTRLILLLFAALNIYIAAQDPVIEKIEPPNWWAGMHHNKIQLMVYGEELKGASAEFNTDKIKILKVNETENPSYLFVDIEISDNLTPGDYTLSIMAGGKKVSHNFPVKQRIEQKDRYRGFNPKDIIYLITPDRFANGDTSNDIAPGMMDRFPESSPIGRHGGDLQGIIDKLDYIKELGVSAVWLMPVVENDQGVSYHGYAATDLYKVDPRFGSNELYFKFADEARRRGLKVIYDHVNNHIGLNHRWIKNIPMQEWLNGTPEDHHGTPHFNVAIKDPNSDDFVTRYSQTGWFVNEMPDMNQRNPFLANYLIQNTIWWIESAGLDGIREDTYPYSDQEYLSHWAEEIFKEYPGFSIVGEVWIGDPLILSGFQKDSPISKINTHLPSVTDFALRDAVEKAFGEKGSLNEIYETISRDAGYTNPNYLLTFLDNHDITRIMYITDESVNKYKMALTLLLTTRGIPQIYYGTEIGIKGNRDHGAIRSNFPGGFPGDERNAFTDEGRTEEEKETYNFLTKLIQIRNENPELSGGKLYHYPVMDEIYCYFRELENNKSFIILNNKNEKRTFPLSRLPHKFTEGTKLKDLLTGEEITVNKTTELNLAPEGAAIYKFIQ